jgi:endonuclease/exonuclease/phosphatase family metal-dependent hydrolase
MCLNCPIRLDMISHSVLMLFILGLDLVHFLDRLLPGHIPRVVVENILQDGGFLHVIEPHLDLRQGKEFLRLHHSYQKKEFILFNCLFFSVI